MTHSLRETLISEASCIIWDPSGEIHLPGRGNLSLLISSFHNFGNDLVLALQFLLQLFDGFEVFCLRIQVLALKAGCSVFE